MRYSFESVPIRDPRVPDPPTSQVPIPIIIVESNNNAEYLPASVNMAPGAHLTIIKPPCSCSECDQQFRNIRDQQKFTTRYRSKLSEREAMTMVANLVGNMNRDLMYLRNQCSTNGNAIMSRWKKKSRDKRKKILLTADPNMFPESLLLRHNMRHGMKGSLTWHKLRERRTSYLLPYINIPTLRDDPSKLLCLLFNRAHFSPEQWAPYDNTQLRLGWYNECFDVDYFFGSIIMHGSRYGHLTAWSKSTAEIWATVGFPRGVLILEAQAHMMALLRKIVEILLEGVDSNTGADKWSEFATTGFRFSSSTVHRSAFLNQPFSPASTFNINRLLSIAQTHLDEAGDYLWLLQTDPTYMRREIGLIGQAHQRAFSKVLGSRHHFITRQLQDYLETFLEWEWVRDECQNAKYIITRFSDNISPDAALSSKELQGRYFEDSGFRKFWSATLNERNRGEGGPAQIVYAPKETLRDLPKVLENDPLHWALQHLVQTNPEDPGCIDHIMAYSMVNDYLTKSSSIDSDRVSPRLYQAINNCAAFQEILSIIRLNRPLSTNRSIFDCYVTEDRRSWRWLKKAHEAEKNSSLVLERDTAKAFPQTTSELHRLIRTFEAIPLLVVGRPDQTWVDSFDNRHTTLNAFWSTMRDLWRKNKTRFKVSKEDIEKDLSVLQADQNPEYLEAVQKERAKLLARIAGQSVVPKHDAAFVQTEWAHEEVGLTKASLHNKKKTRPQHPQLPAPAPDEEIKTQFENLSITKEAPVAVKIPVKQQTYNILTAMFHADVKKEYDWDAFVAALCDAGFVPTQSSGSAVSFAADESRCPWEGKINFHRPHPVAKIDSIMLQAMGKRMKKWFGWEEGTFEVATRKAQ